MKDSNDRDSAPQVRANERLEALVAQIIKVDGQEFEGKTWAILPMTDWADMADVSVRTVSRTFAKPPFDTLKKHVEGRITKLVRIGGPDPNQPSRIVSQMRAAYVKRTGRKPTKDGYGCLFGLAKDFRPGWQLEIFKYAISEDGWKLTKDLSGYYTQDLETPLCETNGLIKPLPGKAHLFQKHPCLKTLRLFWKCAESAFVDHMQGQELTTEQEAYFQDWWKEVDPFKLVEWEPEWKSKYSMAFGRIPVKDAV